MNSPARRALELLRQHFLLLSGPWLAVSAASFVVLQMVQLAINRYTVVNFRTLRGVDIASSQAAGANIMRASYIRVGAIECVVIVECAFKVIALAVMALLVAQIAKHGSDTFSAALERLRKIPAVAGTLLKFYSIVLGIGLITQLVATLPLLMVAPLAMQWHISAARFVRWVPLLSTLF